MDSRLTPLKRGPNKETVAESEAAVPPQHSRLPAPPPAQAQVRPRLPHLGGEAEPMTTARPSALPTLKSLLQDGRDLPALPAVVLQIMEITGRGESSTRQLAQAASQDPMFAARMLRMANSAHYGLPRSVGTLTEAAMMLGNYTIRNLAVVAAAHDSLKTGIPGYCLEAEDLWRHSVACAMTTGYLADLLEYADREEAFVAGLLHDVGKVLLGRHVGAHRSELARILKRDNCDFVSAERKIFGFDHAEVGGRIALHWNLPTALAQAIAWHHQPTREGRTVPLAALIHVANCICLMAGVGVGLDGLYVTLHEAALETLQIDETHIEKALGFLAQAMHDAQPLFVMS